MSTTTWFIYIIETKSGSLYTGITTDVERRFNQHQSGKGSKYLRGKEPLTLKLSFPIGNRSSASQVEYRVKQLPKKDKVALIKQPKTILELLPESN